MLIDSAADDIVYSFIHGVHGNYLKGSVENAGLDPNNLPEADKSSMNFGSGEYRCKGLERYMGFWSRDWFNQRLAICSNFGRPIN